MAATRHLAPGFDSKGASLGEDGATVEIRFLSGTMPNGQVLRTIDCLTRSLVLADRAIETIR